MDSWEGGHLVGAEVAEIREAVKFKADQAVERLRDSCSCERRYIKIVDELASPVTKVQAKEYGPIEVPLRKKRREPCTATALGMIDQEIIGKNWSRMVESQRLLTHLNRMRVWRGNLDSIS